MPSTTSGLDIGEERPGSLGELPDKDSPSSMESPISLAEIEEERSSHGTDGEDEESESGSVTSGHESRKRSGRHKPGSSSRKDGQIEDSGWDTDLEIEDEKADYDISGSKIYQETCQELGVVPASYFIRNLKEESLVMRHHGLGPNGAKALAIPLVTNTCVTELDLRDNWIQGEGAQHLSEMLKENCYISHLTIADNRLGSAGAIAICDMLLSNSALTHINLSGNGFSDKDAALFAEAILSNSMVKELNLSHNEFGVGAGDVLGHAIGENEAMDTLDLSWNHFRGKAALSIMEGVKVNSRLKSFSLAWNGLGNEGTAAVADCIKTNHVLTELDISNNRITIEGTEVIARSLDVNETLLVFKMGQNAIGAEGAMNLLQHINNERSVLEELDLTDVCVSQDFEKLHREITDNRTLFVTHGGILGTFAHKPKKNKDELDPEELAALRALEDFLKNDPMALLQAHCKRKNLRLLDLFKELDKNKDYRINVEDVKRGVKNAGLDLTDEKIDNLIAKMDNVKDGFLDYSHMAGGKMQAVKTQRRLSRVVLDTFESTGRTTLPMEMFSSPALSILETHGSKLAKLQPGLKSAREDDEAT